MTPADRAKKRLWDANDAIATLATFVSGRNLDAYLADPMLQSAVERKLAIVGEALAAARKIDPELTSAIPEMPQIIAFRNVLIHQYGDVDGETVWVIATTDAPVLGERITALIGQDD